jgi:hypothetical protein
MSHLSIVRIAFFLMLIMTLVNHRSYCQSDKLQSAKNTVYIELGGVAGNGSLNYEKLMFRKNMMSFSIRAGVGTYHVMDFTDNFNPDIIIPISLFGTYGRDHKIEISFGQTYASIVKADLSNFNPSRNSTFHSNFSIGYRYQKNTAGFFFRFAYSPIIQNNLAYRNWVGMSIGYSF